jgi:outer membrane protein OmpA-like peptidoglycan-associated protein
MYLRDGFDQRNHTIYNRPEMKKTVIKLLFLFFALAGVPGLLHAQKAKLKLAEKYFQSFDFKTASDIYKDVLSSPKHKADSVALRRVAECELRMENYSRAEGYYKMILSSGKGNIKDMKCLADVLKVQGKFAEAYQIYSEIVSTNASDDVASRYIGIPDFESKIKIDSSLYKVWNAGVNTKASEFAPGFFIGGKLIFASSRGEADKKNQRLYNWNQQPYLNIYTCDMKGDSTLGSESLLGKELNSRYHEGTISYQPATNVIFFTRNNYVRGSLNKSKKGRLNLGMYSSKYLRSEEEMSWENLQKFPHNNKEYSVGHPTLSSDGNTIYFVSDMPGGYGGTDIYSCKKEGETWGAPKNLGKKINTSGNEMFPFLVSDSTLYFSSDGQISLGGLDIFVTNVFDESEVKNMGYPLNSVKDDFGFICIDTQNKGYLSSNRAGGKGDDDIYVFKMNLPATIEVSGIVLDEETLKPIANALIQVTNEDGSTLEVKTNDRGEYKLDVPHAPEIVVNSIQDNYQPGMVKGSTNPRMKTLKGMDIKMKKVSAMASGIAYFEKDESAAIGAKIRLFEVVGKSLVPVDSVIIGKSSKYSFPLKPNKKYMSEGTLDGYSRLTYEFNTNDPNAKVISHDFSFFELGVGVTVRLDNIFYDKSKSFIRPDAALELNKLVQILKDNPGMRIELSSHCDARGSDAYNLKLSDDRAKAAADYIVSQGIDRNRLVGKGYGEQKLLNRCKNDVECSEEEHQFNRRTEFTILAVK